LVKHLDQETSYKHMLNTVRIVNEASSILRDMVDEEGVDTIVGTGSSGDATRRVDQVIEDYIVDRLRETFGNILIVTEEKGVLNAGGYYDLIALVDPLDGSLNYVSKIPLAAVSIVIYESSKPYLNEACCGAVANVFGYETYSFDKTNVYINNRLYVSRDVDVKGLVSIYSYNPFFIKTTRVRLARKLGVKPKFRTLGSAAIESIYAALNRIDMFIHNTGRLRNLDIAGGVAIAKRLGVPAIDLDGGELNYIVDRIERIRSIVIGRFARDVFEKQ